MHQAILSKYIGGYSHTIQSQAQNLMDKGVLGRYILEKYPNKHDVRNDKALAQKTMEWKNRFMRNTPPIHRVCYDNKLRVLNDALGLHTTSFKVHGSRTVSSREIRIATVFRDAPEAFLEMILVHELAHQKEREHNKAFYQLCQHICPDYFQRELDTRLYLIVLETAG